MSTCVEINDIPTRWPELIALASRGGEVIVTENQVPRAKLIPVASTKTPVLGLHPGAIETTADFDDPLPDDFWAGTT